MRLLPGSQGTWAVGAGKVAFLPSAAAADESAIAAVADQLRRSAVPLQQSMSYAVTVLTSTDCNLPFPDYFQNSDPRIDEMRYSPRIPVRPLSAAGIAQIVAFINQQVTKYQKSGVDLLLFGGEPLLRYDACIGLLEAFAPVPLVAARITTNATLLTASRATELEARGLRAVNVTFDGGSAAHDQMRYTRSGRGTYRTILRRIEEATAASTLRWSIRVNVSHLNSRELPNLVEDLLQVCDPGRCTLHLAPLRDYGSGAENGLATVASLAAPFKEAYSRALGAGFDVGVPLDDDLVSCAYCTERGGVTGAVIGSDGLLYSCRDNAGKPGKAVGNILHGYQPDLVNSARWHGCSADVVTPHFPNVMDAIVDEVDGFILDWYRDHGVAMPSASLRCLCDICPGPLSPIKSVTSVRPSSSISTAIPHNRPFDQDELSGR